MYKILDILAHIKMLDVIDITLVAYVFYKVFILIKDTRALQVLKGLIILILGFSLAHVLGLKTLSWLMRGFGVIGLVAAVVLFQPELRNILARIGRGPFKGIFLKERIKVVEEILKAVKLFSERHTGALIVIQQKVGLGNVIETGTVLDCEISIDILQTIFAPTTILHDGAVIIQTDRIIAASCLLPLTVDANLSKVLGTRHRAAVGLSEVSDAIVIVVSEETGIISIARAGKLLRDLEMSTLEKILMEIYHTREM
ncbi:MAG: diadenylate cyclase CdaA [bacterium]